MDCIEKLGNTGIVPVVVIDHAEDAVKTAKALLDGGIDVMEITLRTDAAIESIRKVVQQEPDMLVGAGTVLSLEKCKEALEAGARFIVSPGFDEEIVEYCVEKDVAVIPGCVTPTEITTTLKYNLKVLKFFPANVYGGLLAMKALSGPFGMVKFIPTGGINAATVSEYLTSPFIHAVGGSWMCDKSDILKGNFEKITQLCKEAVINALGFELGHIGINIPDPDLSLAVTKEFYKAFGFGVKEGNSSNFAGEGLEVMKQMYLGRNGHIAIRTNNIKRAIAYLEKNGILTDLNTAKYNSGKMTAVYLQNEIGGFAVHLVER